jgi:hypothetical protein
MDCRSIARWLFACVTLWVGVVAPAQAAGPTSETSSELRKVLKLYPRADTNGDGVLDAAEAAALRKQIRAAQLEAGTDTWRHLRGKPPVAAAPAKASDRAVWPVVISGADLLGLRGIPPKQLVAFQYSGRWRQIPVQVDERAVVEFHDIYNKAYFRKPCFRTLVYTDPDTYTGADPDTSLDTDDEIVFMARDAADKPAAWSDPPGVVAGSGVQVEIADPRGGAKSYAYLFRSEGKLDPSAGKKYVEYTYKLKAGDYRKNFRFRQGPNPEDSTVTTPCYTRHFSDRWISDGLTIRPPRGTGVDLLDMYKSLFAPGMPMRSMKTFCVGEGAFIVNKSGPVRGIRSYVGCNSGPLTQGRHFFYDRCENYTVLLRVHMIPALVTFADYSPEAKGMTYSNNLNPEGVTVDGKNDRLLRGTLTWETLSGKGGALITLNRLVTTIPNYKPTSYYLDAENSKLRQITGDPHAFGASGPYYSSPIRNTDPRQGTPGVFVMRRILIFEGPTATIDTARSYLDEAVRPLTVRLSPPGR